MQFEKWTVITFVQCILQIQYISKLSLVSSIIPITNYRVLRLMWVAVTYVDFLLLIEYR